MAGYIYNITYKVAGEFQGRWLTWLKGDFIPQVLKSGCFENARILRLLDVDDAEGPTFAVQFYTPHLVAYQRYKDEHRHSFEALSQTAWGGRFVAFDTFLEVVD